MIHLIECWYVSGAGKVKELASFYMHKFKCMPCSLHFIVCSDYEEWPRAGRTDERDPTPNERVPIYCPECGSTGVKIHWREVEEGFIFQAVPGLGDVPLINYG